VGVGIAALLAILAVSVTPRFPPPGIDALLARVTATTTQEWRGAVEVTAVQHPGSGRWVTATALTSPEPLRVFSNPWSLQAGRTTTGLSSVLTRPVDVTLTVLAEGGELDPVSAWGQFLATHPDISVRVVVRDHAEQLLLTPLVARWGPERVEVISADAQ
jgi:hypothetical protein